MAPDLVDSEWALAWARAERGNLLACLDHATATGQHARVIALSAGLAGLLRHDGPWADAITRHTSAIQAARHLGDRFGQANALSDLGDVRRATGDYPAAAQAHEQALGIYRDLGDRLGQANALSDLGAACWAIGDYPAAAQAHEQALGMFRDLGDQLGQANSLRYLGNVRRLTGDFPAAAQAQEQALDNFRDLGDRLGQASALFYFMRGVRTLQSTVRIPASARTASNAAVKFEPRSRIMNFIRSACPPRSISKLRACWAVHSPVGCRVTPRMRKRLVRSPGGQVWRHSPLTPATDTIGLGHRHPCEESWNVVHRQAAATLGARAELCKQAIIPSVLR